MSSVDMLASPSPRFWADTLGVWTSSLCFIHCLLTPVLLSFSVVATHFLPSEEKTHRSLAVIVAILGTIALINGFRRHRRARIILLMIAGLACIFGGTWWGDQLPSHVFEVGITTLGSSFMVAAHRLNHTFCRSCQCAD